MANGDTICRLYAVIESGESAPERLSAVLAATSVASVLIAPPPGAPLAVEAAQPLVDIAQRANVAALIADDARLARTLRADGVHLGLAKDIAAAYQEARGILGPGGLIGVDPGISRHDAMTLAEAGADYIAFGVSAHLMDRDKARARRDELIAWWAEIFQAPCVAFDIESPDEAAMLSAAGTDFIAVRLTAGRSPAATRDWIVEIASALAAPAESG